MKYWLTAGLLLMSYSARADFATGLVVGSLLSSGSRTTQVTVQDEFAKQVEQIERNLPYKWQSSASATKTFMVEPSQASKYINYFKNGGWSVTYGGGELTFNLQEQHSKYLQEQEAQQIAQKESDLWWQTYGPWLKYGFLGLVGFIFFIGFIKTLGEVFNSPVGNLFSQTLQLLIKRIQELKSKK